VVHAFVRDPFGALRELTPASKLFLNSGGNIGTLFFFTHRLTSLIGPAKGGGEDGGCQREET